MLADRAARTVGAGGFRYLFIEYIKRYPESYKGGRLFWEHAHSDWLQFPIELGAGGVALLLAGLGWMGVQVVRHRATRTLPGLLLLLGLLQTPLHALVDFPYQNPAVLITWGVLLTLLARASERSDGGSGA